MEDEGKEYRWETGYEKVSGLVNQATFVSSNACLLLDMGGHHGGLIGPAGAQHRRDAAEGQEEEAAGEVGVVRVGGGRWPEKHAAGHDEAPLRRGRYVREHAVPGRQHWVLILTYFSVLINQFILW